MEAIGRIERALHAGRVAGSAWSDRHGWWGRALYELVVFGVKQGWAALFGLVSFVLVTLVSRPREHDAAARHVTPARAAQLGG